MALTMEQITTEAMQLPVSSRAELAERLLESMDFPEGNDEVRRAWTEEAIQRRDEVRSGRVQTIPGEQVLAEVRRMLAG